MSFEKIIIWVLSLVYTKQYINKVSRNLEMLLTWAHLQKMLVVKVVNSTVIMFKLIVLVSEP